MAKAIVLLLLAVFVVFQVQGGPAYNRFFDEAQGTILIIHHYFAIDFRFH